MQTTASPKNALGLLTISQNADDCQSQSRGICLSSPLFYLFLKQTDLWGQIQMIKVLMKMGGLVKQLSFD